MTDRRYFGGMRMKKKILSFLLALCLIVALVPMTAFAAEAPSFSGGNRYRGRPMADCFAEGYNCFGRVS